LHICRINLEKQLDSPFNKMTTRVESVIFRKFDMADDKPSASRLILLTQTEILTIIKEME
jgi:hypothetical protein